MHVPLLCVVTTGYSGARTNEFKPRRRQRKTTNVSLVRVFHSFMYVVRTQVEQSRNLQCSRSIFSHCSSNFLFAHQRQMGRQASVRVSRLFNVFYVVVADVASSIFRIRKFAVDHLLLS